MFVKSMHLKNHGPTMNDVKFDGFKPVTVVYGRNGVGKTLISDVFRSIERNAILEPGTARLALNQEASNSVVGGELVIDQYPSADLSKHVRVFNKRFVTENVVSDNSNPSSIVPDQDYMAQEWGDIADIEERLTQTRESIQSKNEEIAAPTQLLDMKRDRATRLGESCMVPPRETA